MPDSLGKGTVVGVQCTSTILIAQPEVLHCHVSGKELSVKHAVLLFCSGQGPAEESKRMLLISRQLLQNAPDTDVTGISV